MRRIQIRYDEDQYPELAELQDQIPFGQTSNYFLEVIISALKQERVTLTYHDVDVIGDIMRRIMQEELKKVTLAALEPQEKPPKYPDPAVNEGMLDSLKRLKQFSTRG